MQEIKYATRFQLVQLSHVVHQDLQLSQNLLRQQQVMILKHMDLLDMFAMEKI